MAKEYRQTVAEKYEKTAKSLMDRSPLFVSAFYEHMHHGKREISTQVAYLRDIVFFLEYECSVQPALKEMPIKQFPIDILDKLTVQDINEYRDYLFTERKLTNSSAKKKLSALSAFYKFLCGNGYLQNNPMINFEYPAINKQRIIKLDAELSNKLLAGILKNDKYLATSEYGEFVGKIPDQVRIKRERLVLRNYAICYLFLGAGLRVSELVGLDVEDINFRQNSVNVIIKGGNETQVYFGDEVAAALRLYLNGIELSPTLSQKYYEEPELFEWCEDHIMDPDLENSITETFLSASEEKLQDVRVLVSHYRRQGRSSFKPDRNCRALFLSSRGKRITVRMVELMIKEMVKTYLPEYDDKELFSPHKLRATCATRILTQTGNIELASTQLNHKGVAVTAAFYAELQKEKRKDQIKGLDVTEW